MNSPTNTLNVSAAVPCPMPPQSPVGVLLRERFDDTAASELELELHIFDCERLWRAAYSRYQELGDPNDREEALLHLHRMNIAILARSPRVQAERHAQFEQHLERERRGC